MQTGAWIWFGQKAAGRTGLVSCRKTALPVLSVLFQAHPPQAPPLPLRGHSPCVLEKDGSLFCSAACGRGNSAQRSFCRFFPTVWPPCVPERARGGLVSWIGIPVHFPGFQRNAPGGKKFVYGAEEIALGVELIHHLESGVHRLGKDVMHEDDGPVLRL